MEAGKVPRRKREKWKNTKKEIEKAQVALHDRSRTWKRDEVQRL